MENTITDVKCPYCGSIDTQFISTDEIEFEPDGTGHYFVDCACFNCNRTHREYYKFRYEITESWNR